MGRATDVNDQPCWRQKWKKDFLYSSVVSLEIGCGIFQKINIKCLWLLLLLCREERKIKFLFNHELRFHETWHWKKRTHKKIMMKMFNAFICSTPRCCGCLNWIEPRIIYYWWWWDGKQWPKKSHIRNFCKLYIFKITFLTRSAKKKSIDKIYINIETPPMKFNSERMYTKEESL